MVPAVQNFIVERMSQQYIEPPTFDLSLSYEDSQYFSPLVFLLSPGADPMAGLYRFAEEKGKPLPPPNTQSWVCFVYLRKKREIKNWSWINAKCEVFIITVLNVDDSLYSIAWKHCKFI